MVLAGLGLLASLPAESLPMAASSVGAFVLAGILWMLTEISRQLDRAEPVAGRVESPQDESARQDKVRRGRILMVTLVAIFSLICLMLTVLHNSR